ncbi:hypothetical protein [Methylobacterium pseudosasicola]|uniref:Uncharacterized protein n=1 Tax=Methylobacterium pseudosasicola TaxID=582667 RepID=A0A1I4U6R8_9HYPH|nr:hypothetical protein [Methylobacterium pseudosasicola]SFM84668.1 hypothetical protein SAMN05192568_10644 [Methylobacterium pseudosasicola]
MSHETRHVMMDVAGRGAQAFALGHFAIQDFFSDLRERQAEEVDVVQALVAELGRARRRAAAAEAEAAQARRETAAFREANAVLAGEARLAVARAERAEQIGLNLIAAVRRDQAARAA